MTTDTSPIEKTAPEIVQDNTGMAIITDDMQKFASNSAVVWLLENLINRMSNGENTSDVEWFQMLHKALRIEHSNVRGYSLEQVINAIQFARTTKFNGFYSVPRFNYTNEEIFDKISNQTNMSNTTELDSLSDSIMNQTLEKLLISRLNNLHYDNSTKIIYSRENPDSNLTLFVDTMEWPIQMEDNPLLEAVLHLSENKNIFHDYVCDFIVSAVNEKIEALKNPKAKE